MGQQMSNLEQTDTTAATGGPPEPDPEELELDVAAENVTAEDLQTQRATDNTVGGERRLNWWRASCGRPYFIYSFLFLGWAAAFTFLGLYLNLYFQQTGGEILPTPVVLMIAVQTYTQETIYKRLYISGNDTSENDRSDDIRWRNNDQNDLWYLEVSPIRESGRDCPISRNGTFGRFIEDPTFNTPNTSSCNLYDFRLVIFNNLTDEFRHGATVHFHGLTPPSNQDGVPFVSNANIHPQNLQAYRFNQFTYPGLHWMHAHTGFQEAYGVAAPIVLQHSKLYFDKNGFKPEDDLVVMLEEGFFPSPKCAYSTYWYSEECKNVTAATNTTFFAKLALFINRKETPLVHIPNDSAKQMRIRFLNGGSEAPWRITNSFAESNNATKVPMEILATDGDDVVRGVKRDDFVLGLANRIDVSLDLTGIDDTKDILITAVQMKHSNDVFEPALRHIVIRTAKNDKQLDVDGLPTFDKNQTSPILRNFNLLSNLTSAHPLSDRAITRNFTVENRGGDQFGGFPLAIYEGFVKNGSNPILDNLTNLYPTNTYTALNKLKFQLPPYKVFRNKVTKESISTRRACENCTTGSYSNSGIRTRPSGIPYDILYDSNEAIGNNTCCWEWCDVPEQNCKDYLLEDVNNYEPNKHYIPVCFGDRVRILFINAASFENSEGHPMHLHGHEFVLRELYDVIAENYTLVLNTTYDISGPKLDSIWIPFNTAVAFDFDAYNAGEHLFHCHNDFHLENGMMTTVRYMHDDYCSDLPTFVGGENDFPNQICTMDNCTPGQDL